MVTVTHPAVTTTPAPRKQPAAPPRKQAARKGGEVGSTVDDAAYLDRSWRTL